MKLNLFFNPFGIDGYGTHGIEMLRAMVAKNWDVACIPDFFHEGFSNDPLIREALQRGSKCRGACAGIKLNLAVPNRVATFSGKPRIFFTVGEVDRLPSDWVESLNEVDEVWTASEWGRGVFQASGVRRPIRVVPEGVDPSVFFPQKTLSENRNVYRFLCVGKLEERKNYPALFRAYCEEFEMNEPVELVVHFGHEANAHEFLFNLNIGRKHASIRFTKPVSTKKEMALIYNYADAFVLPTRGEGWGLPITEAMACGLPVITTGVGAIKEYTTDQTAFLLDWQPVKANDPFYNHLFQGGNWADPDITQLRRFMRRLFQNPQEGREFGLRASTEIHSKWTWAHAASKASEALHDAGIE